MQLSSFHGIEKRGFFINLFTGSKVIDKMFKMVLYISFERRGSVKNTYFYRVLSFTLSGRTSSASSISAAGPGSARPKRTETISEGSQMIKYMLVIEPIVICRKNVKCLFCKLSSSRRLRNRSYIYFWIKQNNVLLWLNL